MEDKKIKTVKNWPKPKSVIDIQLFLGFANFYWRFIQDFNNIAKLLISIFLITGLSKNLLLSIIMVQSHKVGIVSGGSDCEDEMVKRSPFKNLNRVVRYLTPKARLAFI